MAPGSSAIQDIEDPCQSAGVNIGPDNHPTAALGDDLHPASKHPAIFIIGIILGHDHRRNQIGYGGRHAQTALTERLSPPE